MVLDAHLPLFVTALTAAALGAVILLLGAMLGPKRPSAIKSEAFEGGNPSSGPARQRFNVRYYLVAILFLVFDVEAVFIYPWAVQLRRCVQGEGPVSGGVALMEMLAFVTFIVVGLAYAWRKGALDWAAAPSEGSHHGS
jgi:NADH-quinone oxidoreductase subunit A